MALLFGGGEDSDSDVEEVKEEVKPEIKEEGKVKPEVDGEVKPELDDDIQFVDTPAPLPMASSDEEASGSEPEGDRGGAHFAATPAPLASPQSDDCQVLSSDDSDDEDDVDEISSTEMIGDDSDDSVIMEDELVDCSD